MWGHFLCLGRYLYSGGPVSRCWLVCKHLSGCPTDSVSSHLKKTQRGMRKLKVNSELLQRSHLSSSRWNQSQTVHAERRNISNSDEVHRRHQNNIHIPGFIVGEKHWRLLESGWRKRIVRCMDRIHKICSTEGKATRRRHMVWWETCEETNNLSSRQCMARYVEAYVPCSEKESKTTIGYRETKTRKRQTIERNILHWAKRRRIQAHSESRS